MSKQTIAERKGVCYGCKWAKDQFGASCFCIKYGYIVGYPKNECRGREADEVRKPENDR